MALFKEIHSFIEDLSTESISDKRKFTLALLIDYIQKQINTGSAVNLNFICTHNSRRSHLTQVWAQVMAHHFNIPQVYTYSGGTEATAVFQSVLETLSDSGFNIVRISDGINPVFSINYSENAVPIIGFSKKYDHSFNPNANYCAVLTCAEVDKDCPIVTGADYRLALPYEDPKLYDNTPEKKAKYAERSKQISTELLFVFSQLKTK